MSTWLSNLPISSPVCVFREEFDDWAVLFSPDTAHAVSINPVGVATWELLDGRRPLDDLVAEVRARYGAVPDAAQQEIAASVQDLAQRGFVGYQMEASNL
jgi:SynChlorMet cassette protein ScmD